MKRIYKQMILSFALLLIGTMLSAQVIVIQVNSPAELAQQFDTYGVTAGGWAGQLDDGMPITADLVVVNDESGDPTLGCNPSTAGLYDGKIALIRRGSCPFADKVRHAQDAGALAVIIVNNDQSGGVINMSAADGTALDIPAFMLQFQDGEPLIAAVESGTTVNMTLELIRPNDIGISEFYSPLWQNTYSKPESIQFADSMFFRARIFNVSTVDIGSAIYSVALEKDGEILESESWDISLPARTDDLYIDTSYSIIIDEPLEQGSYALVYSLITDEFDDEMPDNNTSRIEFEINNGTTLQSGQSVTAISRLCFEDATGTIDCNISQPWEHGVMFSIPAIQDSFIINSFSFVVGAEADESVLDDAELSIFWIGVNNYSNLISGSAVYGDDSNEILGFGDYFTQVSENEQEIEVPLFDIANFENYLIPPGVASNYAGIVSVPEGVNLGWDQDWINIPPELDGFVYFWPNVFFYGSNFQRRVLVGALYLKLNLDLLTTVDHVELPETSVKLSPNPASDFTLVGLNFEKPIDATITLADMQGRIIRFNTIEQVTTHNELMSTADLPNGTYIIRVGTLEGTKTKKLIVNH